MTDISPRRSIMCAGFLALFFAAQASSATTIDEIIAVSPVETVYTTPTSYVVSSPVVSTSYVVPTSYVARTSYVVPTVYETSLLTPTYALSPTSYVVTTTRYRPRRTVTRSRIVNGAPLLATPTIFTTPTIYTTPTVYASPTVYLSPTAYVASSLVVDEPVRATSYSVVTGCDYAPPPPKVTPANPNAQGSEPRGISSTPKGGKSSAVGDEASPTGAKPSGAYVPPAQDAQQLPPPAPEADSEIIRRESKKPAVYSTTKPAVAPKRGVLEGTIVAADTSTPVEGVEVVVTHQLNAFAPRKVKTDAKGRFSIGLPSGDWNVVVQLPNQKVYERPITVDSGFVVDSAGEPITNLTIAR
jgi:hypothetical protein